MSGLRIKQKRFADEYIISGNATEAYKKAGYRVSSDRVAGVEGHKLLKNPKIKSY
ncbi:TPA: terminase small subunit, partial [Streptococcus pneumoniae]|nr:terminase small subunit [Streptococcus pneumoniae]